MIVDRIGMNVEMVPHVFDASNGNRPTGKRGVYAVWMNNSKVLIPNAFRRLSVKQA
jgi:predicted phage gp36 major capsid-like protein